MTTDLPTAYPLQWPAGRPRTAASERQQARFNANQRGGYYARRSHTVSECVDAITHELGLMGVATVTVSTNLTLRGDGWPRSGQSAPSDPGAAVYFQYKGRPVCFACDQWTKVEDNLWAVALTLEALRGIDRWGAAQLEASFTGYAALPAPDTERPWWEVLGVAQTDMYVTVRDAYRAKVRVAHPDMGGTAERFNKIQQAWETYQRTMEKVTP